MGRFSLLVSTTSRWSAALPKSAADGSWRDVERKLIGAGSTAISIQPF